MLGGRPWRHPCGWWWALAGLAVVAWWWIRLRWRRVVTEGKGKARVVEPVEHASADVDRVVLVSRRADGTPDQTSGFEVLQPADIEES